MWKTIIFDREAREKVFEWLEEIAKVVATTLGPRWYNVILDNLWTQPMITNDWITVIRWIDYEDRYKNIAALMLKKNVDRTNKLAWDWTSTTAVLARAICKEWLKYIDDGVNPFKLGSYLRDISLEAIDYIKSKWKPIETTEDIKKIASISSQDENVWALIADAFEKVGKDWTVLVQDSKEIWLSIEMKKWYEREEPMKSHLFINAPERLQCELDHPYILITDKKLISLASIKTIVDQVLQAGQKDILFVVDDIDSWALDALLYNHVKKILNVCVVKAPYYAEKKDAFFKDLCALTWATLISNKSSLDFQQATIKDLGRAEKAISWRASTIIVGWSSDTTKVSDIVDEIRKDLEVQKFDEWLKLQAEQRLAKLTWGIATILVGSASEIETENKRMKIEDALQAVKAAIKEWVIYGEWVSLIEAFKQEKIWFIDNEQAIAYKILEKAFEYPTRTIVDNWGDSWEYAVRRIKENKILWTWYDIKNGRVFDLLEAGVIDPVMVVRVAIENAVSLAIMLLTSKSVVTEDPKQKFDDQDARVV